MKKLTGKEIIDILEKNEISWEDLGYESVDWKSLDLGDVVVVDRYGGEGCGDKYYVVYHFVSHNVYLRINGYYQSYHGAEFEQAPYEVTAVSKTVIFYE